MDMHKANRTKGGRPAKTTSERDRQQQEEARQEGLECGWVNLALVYVKMYS